MALADILNRIETDSTSEAAQLTDAARAEAERVLDDARSKAEEVAATMTSEAARDAALGAATIIANARLEARDSLLEAKRGLLESALDALAESIVALPDAEYQAYMARSIVHAARGSERVCVAPSDAGRLAGLPDVVATVVGTEGRDLQLVFDPTPADIEHGVVLLGDRDRVDLSIVGIIDAQREDLVMRLASRIFVAEEAGA